MRGASKSRSFGSGSWLGVLLIAAVVSGCDDGSNQSMMADGTSAVQGVGAAASQATQVTQASRVLGTFTCREDVVIRASARRNGDCVAGRLTIAGAPAATVLAGNQYSFRPVATAPARLPISFSIQNKPEWASFDPATGALTGSPAASDVGTYSGILISANVGTTSVALPQFAIAVTQSATGSVTVSWMPPTTNSDGTAITDLAGYQLIYGTDPSQLVQAIDVNSPGLTTYVIDNLTPGTWYFAIKAINNNGVDSNQSAVVSFTLAGT